MKNIYVVLSLLFFPIFAFSQTIDGKVVDEKGIELVGVNISNATQNSGTVSDLDGSFKIKANSGDKLVFSYIGYENTTVNASSGMRVVLKEQANQLQDVVVIGYGSAKKRDLTGSIVKVSGKEIADKPNTNPLNSLQGKVAGLNIVNSGTPGSEPDVRIRGTASLFQTKPLYVVDGIFNDNINYVNPADIESMEVLKDPSSLAVFGARGANGVIIVTTKKGKIGKTTINYNTSIGIKSITNQPDLTNASQFKSLYDQQRTNQGVEAYQYYNVFTGNTDWIDEITNDSATINFHNLSISNATEKNKFYLGFGYVNEEGIIKNELYKKFTFNINDELIINDRFKVGVSINGSDERLPRLGNYISAINATPIVTPFNNELGVYNQLPIDIGGAQVGNPLLS